MSDELAALAADAYVYGFPLVFDLQMVSGKGQLGLIKPGPVNSFSHASKLAGPDDRFVSINNDTLCSIAQVGRRPHTRSSARRGRFDHHRHPARATR